MSYCPFCGAADAPSPCPRCGQRFTPDGIQIPPPPPGPSGPGGVLASTRSRAAGIGSVPIAAAALLLGAALGGAGGYAVGHSSASPSSSAARVTAEQTPASTVTVTSTETAAGSDSTETVTETSTETVTGEASGSAEYVDSVPGTTWAIVLESLPKGSVSLEQAKYIADVVTLSGRPLVVMDSDAISGFNSGYWVVGQYGYSSESGARSGCAEYDREDGGRCYPRHIG